jgi:Predicted Zn-dependent protease
MDIFIFIAFGLSLWAQFRVKGTFNKWSEDTVTSGISGYEAARRLLDANGLYDVPIEAVPGSVYQGMKVKEV